MSLEANDHTTFGAVAKVELRLADDVGVGATRSVRDFLRGESGRDVGDGVVLVFHFGLSFSNC